MLSFLISLSCIGMATRKDYGPRETPGDQPCLILGDLSKHFGGLEAVSHANLTVQMGERRGIIGPNGAGKTTLFNLIAGEFPPTSGKIFFFGRDITKVPAHRRAYLGIARTFQITNLFFNLSVIDNFFLAAQALKRTKFALLRPAMSFKHLYDKADEILTKVGIIEKRNEIVKNLSHGEQRQIEVGMALLGEPRLLLLDEPTAGLAPAESSMIVSLLKTLDKKITLLIIEHDMDVAFELSDRITVLNLGKVLAEGAKGEIQASEIVQKTYLGIK